MNPFILTCGSTADLNKEYYEKHNIPCICYHYSLDDKEYLELNDEMSISEFYDHIVEGAMPATSQINMAEFYDFFEPFAAKGYDILHLCFSSGLSGTINNAVNAAEELMEKYPSVKIKILDSLSASTGYGLLLDYLVTMRDNGATFDEIAEYAESNNQRFQHWFYSTDLTYFKKGGRISSVSFAVGTLLSITPIMTVSKAGKLEIVEKSRGRKKALSTVVDKMKELAENGIEYSGKCFVNHSACPEEARLLADAVEKAFPNLSSPVEIYDIGTVIGSHCGTGTVSLFYYGSERTVE